MSNENKVMTFLTPQNAQEAFEIANNLSQSSLLPSAMKGKPADIVVAMAYGAELGLQPLQSLQNIAVINGRPSLWGDAVRALVLNSHDLISLEEWDENGTFHCRIKRASRSGGEIITHKSFGDAEATKAGLLGKQGPWKQYPERMKQMRAFGFAARDAFADRLRGFITREEANDLPPEKDVTPQPTVETGNDVLDSIIGEVEQEASELPDLDFALLSDKILQASNMIEFADAMEEVSKVDNATDKQLAELRATAKKKKAELAKPKPQDIEFEN